MTREEEAALKEFQDDYFATLTDKARLYHTLVDVKAIVERMRRVAAAVGSSEDKFSQLDELIHDLTGLL